LLLDGKNGYLVNSPIEASKKIIYLLQNPQITKKISRAAHESVLKKFLMPHRILKYLELYQQLLLKNSY